MALGGVVTQACWRVALGSRPGLEQGPKGAAVGARGPLHPLQCGTGAGWMGALSSQGMKGDLGYVCLSSTRTGTGSSGNGWALISYNPSFCLLLPSPDAGSRSGGRSQPGSLPTGAYSPTGTLRGMQRPHWLTGGQGRLWPRPCLSGLADPAEEQRTQKTGSPAGRARVACKPLLSQKGERTLPPCGVCSGPNPSFFLEHEQPPGWRKSMTGAWLWAPHPLRDPAGRQLEPSLCLGVHSFRAPVVHPALAALPGGQCCCPWPCFQAADGQQVFGSPPPPGPPCVSSALGPSCLGLCRGAQEPPA